MSKVIMIGCDLHDRSMLLRYAVGTGQPQQLSYDNDARGRGQMVSRLKGIAEKQQATRIVFAYEASGQGYGLSDTFESVAGKAVAVKHRNEARFGLRIGRRASGR